MVEQTKKKAVEPKPAAKGIKTYIKYSRNSIFSAAFLVFFHFCAYFFSNYTFFEIFLFVVFFVFFVFYRGYFLYFSIFFDSKLLLSSTAFAKFSSFLEITLVLWIFLHSQITIQKGTIKKMKETTMRKPQLTFP